MEPYISSFPRAKTNDKILSDMGAFITDGFSCAPDLQTKVWSGVGRNSFHVASQNIGLQTITLPMVFEARSVEKGRLDLSQWPAFRYDDQTRLSGKLILDEYPKDLNNTRRAEIELNIRKFEQMILGKFTLNIGDGFEYQCVLTKIGKTKWYGENFCEKTYTLSAIKAYPLRVISVSALEEVVVCNSNVPKTDCKIIIDAPHNNARKILTLGNLVFDSTYSLDYPLVIDGINKQIKANGENCVSKFSWSDFPFLVPGENNFKYVQGVHTIDDVQITIEYYPTFM